MAGSGGRSMEETPTYASATVLFIFVLVSLIIERSIHYLGWWLKKTKRKAFELTLERMKEELMLLGFISLLLTVFNGPFSRLCVKTGTSLGHQFVVCELHGANSTREDSSTPHRRLLGLLDDLRVGELSSSESSEWREARVLADAGSSTHESITSGLQGTCSAGKEPFVSTDAVHQIHIFLFALACTHILYSVTTMGLAFLKVRSWKSWEVEAQRESHILYSDRATGSAKRLSSFKERHQPYWGHVSVDYVVCFFRQFYLMLSKSDYKSMRLAFISVHNIKHKFDFHSYILRSLEDDFQRVVGISEPMWLIVLAYIIFDIPRYGAVLYIPLFFVAVAMLMGAKLVRIIQVLAREVNVGSNVMVTMKPRDSLFWFHRPQILILIIHLLLFSASYQLASIVFHLCTFGWDACYITARVGMAVRGVVAIVLLFYTSYVILPVYSVVSQMGTHYKKAIFSETVQGALGKWVGKRGHKRETISENLVHGVGQGVVTGVGIMKTGVTTAGSLGANVVKTGVNVGNLGVSAMKTGVTRVGGVIHAGRSRNDSGSDARLLDLEAEGRPSMQEEGFHGDGNGVRGSDAFGGLIDIEIAEKADMQQKEIHGAENGVHAREGPASDARLVDMEIAEKPSEQEEEGEVEGRPRDESGSNAVLLGRELEVRPSMQDGGFQVIENTAFDVEEARRRSSEV